MEGNLRFKIDWASLTVGSKFTVFALFYFVFEGNFPSTTPRGAYIWRRDITEGFFRYEFWGLIFGGLYFRNFTVLDSKQRKTELKLILSKGILMTTGAPNEIIVQNHLNSIVKRILVFKR